MEMEEVIWDFPVPPFPSAQVPACTCRVCLYRAGGGAIEIDEYGRGAGFGFGWEYPSPHLMHVSHPPVSRKEILRCRSGFHSNDDESMS